MIDRKKLGEQGFTITELILSIVIFSIIVIGISNATGAIRKAYKTAREFNEVYTVLSACPELDRALEFNSLSATNNCFPNNTFVSEGAGGTIITYTPVMTVTDASSLPISDPLQTIPDSKVVDISVGFPKSTSPKMELRMLVTRNGVGQL
jgi:prepilin-type N-terminal cleavage/methylation domain-containing protein